MRRAVVALVACIATAGSAIAQEVYVGEPYDDDAGAYIEEPAYIEEDEVVPPTEGFVVGPRVYGWTAWRPANCGTYRYWNGEYCADARFDPPGD